MKLTRLHLDVLDRMTRYPDVERPPIAGYHREAIDAAVEELVLWGLIEGVTVPRIGDDPPHWEPVALTEEGWTLVRRLAREHTTKNR